MTNATTINRTMTPSEWGLLIALSILWSGSFFCVGIAAKELPALTIVTCRVGLAALALAVVIRITGTPLPRSRAAWTAFLVMGFCNNAVPFSLIAWSQHHVASGVASIFNAATPLFAVMAAHVLTADEKATAGRLAGVVIGLAGVAVMIGDTARHAVGSALLPEFAMLAAALSYALGGIFGRRFRAMGLDPLVTAFGQVTGSTVLLLPMTLIVDRPWTLPLPSMATVGALAVVALAATALAFIIYFRILATAGATNLMLVTFLVPVGAILLGVAFLDETLRPAHLAGMALIGAGLAAVDGRPFGFLRRRLMPRRPDATAATTPGRDRRRYGRA
jgi:drug/metabolite transporter (DMT)-like permease